MPLSPNAVNYYNFLRGKQKDITEGEVGPEYHMMQSAHDATDVNPPATMPEPTSNSAGC